MEYNENDDNIMKREYNVSYFAMFDDHNFA